MRISSLAGIATISLALALPFCSGAAMAVPKEATGAATAARGTAMQVSLNKVSNPVGRLVNASVQDKNGESIGTARKVIVNANGKPTAVQVDVGGFLGVGSKLVAIPAKDLKYEQDRNVLTTTLRKPAIEALPVVSG